MNIKLKKFLISDSSIESNRIIAFISCFVTGMIAHGFLIYNQIFNMDSLYVPYGMSPILASGRWVGVLINNIFVLLLKYNLSINSFNIITGIFLLSLCSSQLVEIFNIKKRYVSIVISSLIVVQPAIINLTGYSFVFHLDIFFFFFTTYAVKLLLVKNKIVIPSILLGLSLGIYQAYMPYALTIIFVYSFLYIIDGNDIDSLIRLGLKCLVVFIMAVVIYVVGLKLTVMFIDSTTFENTQVGYKGMDTSGLPLTSIPNLFLNILMPYKAFIDIYTGRYGFVTNFPIMRPVLILVLIIFILTILKLLKSTYAKNKINFIISIIIVLLLPIIINIQLLYYPGNTPRVQTGLFFIFLIPLLLFDRVGTVDNCLDYFDNYSSPKFININKIITNLILFLFIFIAIHFSFVSNGEHYRLYLMNKKYERSMQHIANLIITNKDYKDGMEVMMCGEYKTPKVFMDYFDFSPYNIHDVYNEYGFVVDFSFSYAFMQMTNLKIYIQVPPEDRHKYKDIPNYPNPDCVQKIDDKLILIKFSD